MTGEAVYVAVDGEYAGCLVMGDRLRRDAAPAVQGLKSLGVRRTVLLTGDHDAAAQEAARGAGFDFAYASLFPGDKVAHLEALQKEAASYGAGWPLWETGLMMLRLFPGPTSASPWAAPAPMRLSRPPTW